MPTVLAFRDQFLLVGLVSEALRLLPNSQDSAGRFNAETIIVPKLPVFTACMHEIERRHFDGAHPFVRAGKRSEALKPVMGPIAVFLYQVVGHYARILLATAQLAILDGEAFWILAQSIIDNAFAERWWQVQYLRKVQGYRLARKCFGPFVGVLLVHIEQHAFVISHGLPFRKIRASLGKVHFPAHRIGACEDDANT